MQSRRARPLVSLAILLTVAPTVCIAASAQDGARRGRKYKAPAPTSHIEVEVTKKFNGKPIMNAAVIFDSKLDGKDEGNLEVKTDPDGKATIDVVPTGSTVRVQVIATGYATFAQEYLVDGPSKSIAVAMIHPQAQVSSYTDNDGKASTRKPGVQEPIRPKPATPPASTPPPQL
ncbi:MAG: carboxypeptidase-like regulatory domain-containing protein [Acidobacteriota bacterium]|nr:carboxypeptidase-like regulatory domain-containing protein [Acidobacteriota bacterium]